MRPALTLTAMTLVLALVGCGGGGDEPENQSAAGQVEGGEISDAMLPLDSVRSTSPSDPGGNGGSGDSDVGEPRPKSGEIAKRPTSATTVPEGPVLDKETLPEPECPDGPGKCL